MKNQGKDSVWKFIVFPAVTMLLGWGLRGYIGGGPFGAMIPGAMVAFSLCILLGLPLKPSAIIVVFGVAGIGIGGEMTYGQTLGFLRSWDTTWWGELGITIKGGIWGLLGGAILATGFFYRQLSKKTITIAYLMLFIGMLIGFKLINQPMVIYFSDPAKPRFESWAALLLGAVFYLLYLRQNTSKETFKIIFQFAFWGLIGGGLGFGLGGFWMVLGNHVPKEVIFNSWWKMMEFTFGALFGAALGYVTFLNRKEIASLMDSAGGVSEKTTGNPYLELGLVFLTGLLIYWIIPYLIEPLADPARVIPQFGIVSFADVMLIFSNYAFYGLILILVVMKYPEVAWQFAITLTFCHTALDLFQDVYPDVLSNTTPTRPFWLILGMTFIVSVLIVWFQRKENAIFSLFLVLVWSCILIAFLRLNLEINSGPSDTFSLIKFVFGTYFVHIVFFFSAVYISWRARHLTTI